MTHRTIGCLACLLVAWGCARVAGADALPFKLPDDFEISLYAGDDLVHDCHALTVDAKGRVVVSGPNYVKILHDTDGDGRADKATLFSTVPRSGAHGMYFDGPHLICTGDTAVMRLRDDDGDDRADEPTKPEIWAKLGHTDHGANGIVRGPDGWYYVACGNDAGVARDFINLPASPVRDPQQGAIVRFSPDGKWRDVHAHGFRNPYDLGFDAQGALFTVDSDGERDHHLPWYAPTRLFHVAQGRHHGWVLKGWQRSWNRPAYFFDSMERVAEIGRGSPTGVLCYRHHAFPPRYRQGVFSLCWSLGKLYFIPTEPDGATYRGKVEVFMETIDNAGFAPVDMEVGPAGDLFIAIGGRGTRGSVFRVRYTGPDHDAEAFANEENALLRRVLTAPQPLSSWSRAQWIPLAKRLDKKAFVEAVGNAELHDRRLGFSLRGRAAEVLTELWGATPVDAVKPGADREELPLFPVSRPSRVIWSLGRHPQRFDSGKELARVIDHYFPASSVLARQTFDDPPEVVLGAFEALASIPPDLRAKDLLVDGRCKHATDRRVREAAIALAMVADEGKHPIRFNDPEDRPDKQITERRLLFDLAQLRLAGPPAATDAQAMRAFFAKCAWPTSHPAKSTALDSLRLMQLALGDVLVEPRGSEINTGYAARLGDAVAWTRDGSLLPKAGPLFTGDADADREIGRLIAMMGIDAARVAAEIAGKFSEHSSPVEDIHYLLVLCQLGGERPATLTAAVAEAFAQLHGKMRKRNWHPSRNWPLVVNDAFARLSELDPKLAAALLESKAFGQREHAMLVARMKGEAQRNAARALLAAATSDGRWSVELVGALAALPLEEATPTLLAAWKHEQARDAIIRLLAARPAEEHRALYVERLRSTDPSSVKIAAEALLKLKPPPKQATDALVAADLGEELLQVMHALRLSCTLAEDRNVRTALAALLARWTGRNIDVDEAKAKDPATAYRPWFEWFAAEHPALARRLPRAEIDWPAWQNRLAKVEWEKGDAARGGRLFEARRCHMCHVAALRIGPDLAGVAARLSRDDLFAAIVDPGREVAPPYRVLHVTTKSGDTHLGIQIYESPEGSLFTTGPSITVRLSAEEIVSIQRTRRSLMPPGLLNGVSDGDLADLYAYLKQATKAP